MMPMGPLQGPMQPPMQAPGPGQAGGVPQENLYQLLQMLGGGRGAMMMQPGGQPAAGLGQSPAAMMGQTAYPGGQDQPQTSALLQALMAQRGR